MATLPLNERSKRAFSHRSPRQAAYEKQMTSKLLWILITIAQVSADIHLELSGEFRGSKYSQLNFNHSGEDITPVTKKELRAFGLTDVLFVYAMKVLSGCPENRLQADEMKMTDNFNWIHRRVEVKNAEILSIESRSPLDITHHFQYDIDELPLLLNNVTSTWSYVNNTLLNETIHFVLSLQGFTNYRLVYPHKYGENGTARHQVPPSMRLPENPSKHNKFFKNRRIHISRAAIHLLVEYVFSLDGKVFNLTPMPYGKVHFNTMPINSVMVAANLQNELISKEFIDVELHYDARYVHDIYDADFSECDE